VISLRLPPKLASFIAPRDQKMAEFLDILSSFRKINFSPADSPLMAATAIDRHI
jgi:hypothetical protein